MSLNNNFSLDNLRDYIPFYLTKPQQDALIREIENFPKNKNFYLTNYPEDLKNSLLQGDIFKNLTIYSKRGTREITGIVLSNSCDISPENKRDLPVRALFAPLVQLSKIEKLLLESGKSEGTVQGKIDAMKEQKITNIIYFPESSEFPESVVFLDDIYQVPAEELSQSLENNNKIITLSQYGFYLLLLKLSIHFCRFHEGIARYNI